MNWVPATVPPYVHDALTLVDAGTYTIDAGTGVERVVNVFVLVFVLFAAPIPELFCRVNV